MGANNINVQNDPVLTKLFRGYMPIANTFVRDLLLPKIKVGSKTGDVPEAGSEYLRIHNKLIVQRTGTPVMNVSIDKANAWKTERTGLQIPITKEDGQKFNNQSWQAGMRDAEKMYTRMLKAQIMIGDDYALQQVVQNASIITQNVTLSGTSQFNDYSASDPISVFKTGRTAIFNSTGQEANVAVMNRDVFVQLADHPEIKKTNGIAPDGTVATRELTEAEVAKALGLDRIIVGRVRYNTAAAGLPKSMSQIWGKHVTLCYVNPNPTPDMIEYSLGYTFELSPAVIDIYSKDDPKHTWFVRSEEEHDDVILDALAAYLIIDAVA